MGFDDPDVDLPDLEEKSGSPWIWRAAVLAAMTLIGAWVVYEKYYRTGKDSSAGALEQQLTADKAELAREREKVFELTQQVEALKQGLTVVSGEERKTAAAEYN